MRAKTMKRELKWRNMSLNNEMQAKMVKRKLKW